MASVGELQSMLTEVRKQTHALWEENKDIQGRFVNELGELQRIQAAINQLENENRTEQAQHFKTTLAEMQRQASIIYESLTSKRDKITKKLNEGTNYVAMLQNQLISERLYEWKNRQKLAQIGMPFDDKEHALDEIQMEFEFLAEQNWQLHTYACWMLDFLRRGPQINDNATQATITSLSAIMDQLTKLLFMLVSQSFVVSSQPDPVLKTQHKFVTEVRLLVGDKLGIRQHLVNTNVTVKIIAEDEAKQLSTNHVNHKDIKTVGTISNDFEKISMDERGHLAAKFNNSKLTRIAHRKPPPKGSSGDMKNIQLQAATDQKYALLFHISPFQLGNFGKFDVWTLSLPIMVTVHGSQDCDAQVAILWHRAFASVSRTPATTDVTAVSWNDLAIMLRNKFSLFTGARRSLSDSDLLYLSEKMLLPGVQDQKPISFHRFAKQNLRDDVNFSFWEWFFSIMQLIKQKLLKFWDEGWLIGFISKHDASQSMLMCPHPSFLLRFSDTQTGAVSIGFVCEDEDGQKVPFHLSPFSIKDLDQLSLASRIATCPQLKDIRYLYPNIDKEELLRYFDSEERHRISNGADSPTGYIQSEIVMVAKTSGRMSQAPSLFGADSPLSVHSKLDWSPGEINQSHHMDIGSGDEISMMGNMMQPSDVESLLGPSFKQFGHDSSSHLQFVDMSAASQQTQQQQQPQYYQN